MKLIGIKIFVFILAANLLSACSMLSPVKVEPANIYVINATPQNLPHQERAIDSSLLVNLPQTSSAYNTIQMAYSEKPYQIGYFAKNRWADTPAQMLQPLIIQTLQKTGYFKSVSSIAASAQYDYALNTQILELQQDYGHQPHTVHIRLRAQIINVHTNSIVATKDFSAIEPMLQDNPYSGVTATNKATAVLLKQLADFVMRTI